MKRIKIISGVYLVQIFALCYSIINGLAIPFFFSLEVTSSIFLFFSPLAIILPLVSLIDAIFVSGLVSGNESSYRLFSTVKFYIVLAFSIAILSFYHQSILFSISAIIYVILATQGSLLFNAIQAKGFTRASIRLYIIHIILQLSAFIAAYITGSAYQFPVYAILSILAYSIVLAFEIKLLWPFARYGKSFIIHASYILKSLTCLPSLYNCIKWPTNLPSIVYTYACDFFRTGAPIFFISILIKGPNYAIARLLISLCLVVVSLAPVNPSLFFFLNTENRKDLRSYVQLRFTSVLLGIFGFAILMFLVGAITSWLYLYILSPSAMGAFSISNFVISASLISAILFVSRCLALLTYVQSSLIGLKNLTFILIGSSSGSLVFIYVLVTQARIPLSTLPGLIVACSLLPVLILDFCIASPSRRISRAL